MTPTHDTGQTALLRQTLLDLERLGAAPSVLAGLEMITSAESDPWPRLAPQGLAAGDGWVETSDQVLRLCRGATVNEAERRLVLAAELALTAAISLHWRRRAAGLFVTIYTEHRDPEAPGARPCLVRERPWLATDSRSLLRYRVYWAFEQGALRPVAARLADAEAAPSTSTAR